MPYHNINTPDGSGGFQSNGNGGGGGGTNDPTDDLVQDITCWDGSLASSYDQCPDIGEAWDPATGIGIDPETGELGTGVFGDDWVAPAWWDDPSTTEEDERAQYIYQKVGGKEATGMEFVDFWAKHEEDFPTWEESGFAARYENVLEQLGMLNTTIRLASEDFNLNLDQYSTRRQAHVETALTQKEDIGTQMESQFIGTGGVVSGRRIEAAEAVSENINQALGLEFRGIDLERDLLETSYEGELVNIEGRKIDYENVLIGLEDDYENHLLNLINIMDIQKLDCADDETLCPDGTCASECSCAQQNLEDCGEGICAEDCAHMTAKDEMLAQEELTLGEDDLINLNEGCFRDNTGNIVCLDQQPWMDFDWPWEDDGTGDGDDIEISEGDDYSSCIAAGGSEATCMGLTDEEGSTDEFADAMIGYCSETYGETSVYNQHTGTCEEDPFLAGEGYDINLGPGDYDTEQFQGLNEDDMREFAACINASGGLTGSNAGEYQYCMIQGLPGSSYNTKALMQLMHWIERDDEYGMEYFLTEATDMPEVPTDTSGGYEWYDWIKGLVGWSDVRLKDNIKYIGQSNSGINMYEFNYKGDSNKYRGAMANELVDSHPDAVIKDKSGYYKLDYSKIDVDLERIS